jgi:hypothetical protein
VKPAAAWSNTGEALSWMVDVLNVHLIVGIVLVLFTTVIKKPQTEDAEMAWRRISTQFIAVS